MLLWWQHVLVRKSRGHLLVGMGQVGLRYWRSWLRSWGYLRMPSLRWPWHGAWHHLRVLLGYIALWSLVALGYVRPGLIAILLMWLQLTWEGLLVLGRNTRLRGHISTWGVALLGLERRVRARNSPWSRLVSLRQWLPNGLRVLLRLFMLLWLGCRNLGWAMNGHSWLGHKVRVGPHLWGYSVAS